MIRKWIGYLSSLLPRIKQWKVWRYHETITYIDSTEQVKGIKVSFYKVNLRISDLCYPNSGAAFDITLQSVICVVFYLAVIIETLS